MTIRLFEVGGCVRDEIMGVRTKDFDFAVEGASGMDELREFLVERGFEIFVETPQFLTIRARFPKDHPNRKITADFALCRKDGPSADGRRPDFVETATIHDDLNRRDFTVNAIAKTEDGDLIDPHNGVQDIADRRLRAVGDPMDRFREDGLRALRAIRFIITKGFVADEPLSRALGEPETAALLGGVSTERVRDELFKCFSKDTLGTLDILMSLPINLRLAILRNIKLEPTMRVMKGVR